MSASLTLVTILLLLIVLSAAGARWGVDSRAPGGWTARGDTDPLWPAATTAAVARTADRLPARR